jgi:ADP-ribosylation factor GTPase-activating protein 1
MQKGGNNRARAFFKQSPDYATSMSIEECYNSLFAARYRDKVGCALASALAASYSSAAQLAAECEGRTWDPEHIPESYVAVNAAAPQAGLRKPRAAGLRSASPRPLSPGAVGGVANPYSDQKAQNETFFAGLGSANSTRSADLPPSQGGKSVFSIVYLLSVLDTEGRYAGFGSQPDYQPSQSTSSKAVPTFDDLRDDPMRALTRGWGFFTNTVTEATKVINDSVIKPGLERATDPNLRDQVGGYLSTAAGTLADAGKQGSVALSGAMRAGGERAKRDLGVDVGDMGASYIERLAVGGGSKYATVGSAQSLGQQEAGEVDFFDDHLGPPANSGRSAPSSVENSPSEALLGPAAQPAATRTRGGKQAAGGADPAWDDFQGWKDD